MFLCPLQALRAHLTVAEEAQGKKVRLGCGPSGHSQGSTNGRRMTAVGFEPTQLALAELESTPLDHSGKLSLTLSSLSSLVPSPSLTTFCVQACCAKWKNRHADVGPVA